MCMYICVCEYVHRCVCVYIDVCVCVRRQVFVCMQMCVCVRGQVCLYIDVCMSYYMAVNRAVERESHYFCLDLQSACVRRHVCVCI